MYDIADGEPAATPEWLRSPAAMRHADTGRAEQPASGHGDSHRAGLLAGLAGADEDVAVRTGHRYFWTGGFVGRPSAAQRRDCRPPPSSAGRLDWRSAGRRRAVGCAAFRPAATHANNSLAYVFVTPHCALIPAGYIARGPGQRDGKVAPRAAQRTGRPRRLYCRPIASQCWPEVDAAAAPLRRASERAPGEKTPLSPPHDASGRSAEQSCRCRPVSHPSLRQVASRYRCSLPGPIDDGHADGRRRLAARCIGY